MVVFARSFLLAVSLIQLTGCATNGASKPDYFSTSHDPAALHIESVAVVSDSAPPEIKGVTLGVTRGEGAAAGAGEGALEGALAALQGMGECSGPYCGAALLLILPAFTITGAAIGGISGHAAGKPADALAQGEAKAQQMLRSATLQHALLEKAQTYAYANLDIDFVALPQIDTESLLTGKKTARVEGKPVGHVLEIDLVRLSLAYSLEMDARARLISLQTGDVLSQVQYRFVSEPRDLEGWTADGLAPLAETIERGLRTIAEDVIDEQFLLYYPDGPATGHFAQSDGSDKGKHADQSPAWPNAVPPYVLGPIYPPLESCFLCGGTPFKKGLRTFAYFSFVDVNDVHPTLRWQAFPRKVDLQNAAGQVNQFTNVSYQLRIHKAERAGEYLIAGPVVYEARNLREPGHRIEESLSACADYLWTVRARFKLDGRIRVTEWAGTFAWGDSTYHAPWNLRRASSKDGPEPYRPGPGAFYYPFSTPCH